MTVALTGRDLAPPQSSALFCRVPEPARAALDPPVWPDRADRGA